MTHNLEYLRAQVEAAAADIRQHHEWMKKYRYTITVKSSACVRRHLWKNWRRAMTAWRAAQNIRRAA